MSLEELIKDFVVHKNSDPIDVNELLDFVQKKYIDDKLCIVEYRNLFRELHDRGALKPEYSYNQ